MVYAAHHCHGLSIAWLISKGAVGPRVVLLRVTESLSKRLSNSLGPWGYALERDYGNLWDPGSVCLSCTSFLPCPWLPVWRLYHLCLYPHANGFPGLPCCSLHHEGMQSRGSCRPWTLRLLETLPPKLQAKFYLLMKLAVSSIHYSSRNLALGTASVCGLCYTLFMLCSYKTMLTGHVF